MPTTALPRAVTLAQIRQACAVLGVPEDFSISEVTISLSGDAAGLTLSILARGRSGDVIADPAGGPLTAYAHVPLSPEEAHRAAADG